MAGEFPVTEHVAKSTRHTTFYLSCGPAGAPLVIFVHGWPELSLSWRHQLPCFASLGFRAVAPDMRGYGRSSVYRDHEDYRLEVIVEDMLELLGALGADKAVWVGHDWGSPVVWSLASHHPSHCHAVANLCVPYLPEGFSIDNLISLVDRTIYPAATYPAGQWDYQLFYEENFDKARAAFEADVSATIRALFRKGNPELKGKPSRTAQVRRDGGWFGGSGKAPSLPRDDDVVSEQDLAVYVAALQRNGFFGPDSWYMNRARNAQYAKLANAGGRLTLPVLFLHGRYDYTCQTVDGHLAEPMRTSCDDLTEAIIDSGHWMAQERPAAVNSAIARWLGSSLPALWTPPLDRAAK
jgi:pimeloyl-ACP methyl ester carboxylesterase